MKNLLLSILLLPLAAFGQKFEISEQVGISQAGNLTNGLYIYGRSNTTLGFSNQISFGYRPIKHLAVSAFYELNQWDPKNNSYGIAADFTSKYFFAGADIKMASLATINYGMGSQVKYDNSLGYGIHAGARQKIFRKLYSVEQVGYCWMALNGTVSYQPDIIPYPAPTTNSYSFSETVRYSYLRAGLALKF